MFCTNNFRKIILFFFFIFFSLVFTKDIKADCHGYYCGGINMSTEPFDSSMSLSWNSPIRYRVCTHEDQNLGPVNPDNPYQIKWFNYSNGLTAFPFDSSTNSYTCPTNSPTTDCGTTTAEGNQNSLLITGLQNGQKYLFYIRYFIPQICDRDSSTFSPFYSLYSSSQVGFCGDEIVENQEECDGSNLGLNLNTSSCSVVRAFDSGGILSCNPPGASNACTYNTSQCIACNNIQAPTMSNNINNLNLVATDAKFNCLVQADHQGPGVLCQVLNSVPAPSPISTCNFVSWQGNTAKFNCTAPSTPSGINDRYFLQAVYAVLNNNQSSGIISSSNCGRNSPALSDLNVISADNTPPTITVTENYGHYTNENPQQELTIPASCTDSGGSGCDATSIKLQRFNTKPTSCPTDYSSYNLASPNTPALSKTAWFCGSAKDRLGNTGFSPVTEIKPGCRDQCQALHARSCGDPEYIQGEPYDHTRDCRNIDQDSCLEWVNETLCGKYLCQSGAGYCKKNTFTDNGQGSVSSTLGGGIDGVNVSFQGNKDSGGYTTYNGGLYTIHDTLSTSGTVSVTAPPGWIVARTVCHAKDCTGPDTVTEYSGSHSCDMYAYFDRYGTCNEDVHGDFYLTPTDTTPPTVSTSITPTGTISTSQSVTIQADTTDNIGVSKTEIYVDGGLAKRCTGSMINVTPNPSPCQTTPALYSAGDHSYYAIAYDNVNHQTTSSTQTFTVAAPSSSFTTSPSANLPPRATGLVSTPSLTGSFPTSGAAVIDPKAAFAPFKIPTFDDLKSLYYDQKK